jgi:hypothetical protein
VPQQKLSISVAPVATLACVPFSLIELCNKAPESLTPSNALLRREEGAEDVGGRFASPVVAVVADKPVLNADGVDFIDDLTNGRGGGPAH